MLMILPPTSVREPSRQDCSLRAGSHDKHPPFQFAESDVLDRVDSLAIAIRASVLRGRVLRRMIYQRWLRVACYFLTCLEAARQRRQLLALDERTLKDVGISRTDALREASRHFWDLPEHLKFRR